MERLLELGFIQQGEWMITDDSIDYNIGNSLENCSLLYCFAVNNVPKYIGVTRKGLNNRMYQYKNPSVSQTTNTRINIKIRETLNESRVQIYTLVDNGQLQISGFSVNIAFGLEHTLINEYNPEWNLMGRLTQLNNIVVQPVDQVNFGIRLVQTYKTQGFINIPVAYEEYFGMDNDIINVRFNNQIFEGNINRRSNNGYPRIYVGPVLSNWLSQFELDTTISINLYDGILNLEIRN